MINIKWSELFPARNSAVIFVLYVVLSVSHGLLVIATQNQKKEYDYNIASVLISTETLKLFISMLFYCIKNKSFSFVDEIITNLKILKLYCIPAGLYCIYNILSFINLSNYDLTTYTLLLNFRVVVTGLLFQKLFKKRLSRIQWISLILLTTGCAIKQISFEDNTTNKSYLWAMIFQSIRSALNFELLLILIQVMCACFAGVYCEYLLKVEGSDVDLHIHNIFMYLDSIICNLAVCCYQEGLNLISWQRFSVMLELKVLFVIINTALLGIVTSFFLKSLNSITKTFASAVELSFTAIFNYLIFKIPLYFNTFISIFIVTSAIMIYAKYPVVNTDNIIYRFKV